MLLEYLANDEAQVPNESVLVQKTGHVDDVFELSALDVRGRMDGQASRYTREGTGMVPRRRSGKIMIERLLVSWWRGSRHLSALDRETSELMGIAVSLSMCRPGDTARWDVLKQEDQDLLEKVMDRDEP